MTFEEYLIKFNCGEKLNYLVWDGFSYEKSYQEIRNDYNMYIYILREQKINEILKD
jgi:hypothetical protein